MALLFDSPFQPMFNFIWTILVAAYPSLTLYAMLTPSLEEEILKHAFWVIYIFGTIQVGLVTFNYEIILGDAAKKFKTQASPLVGSIAWLNTALSVLTVLVHGVFATFAERDFTAWTQSHKQPAKAKPDLD